MAFELKRWIAISILLVLSSLAIDSRAAILSIDSGFGPDSITRDTESGLDWLDLTVTRGMSYEFINMLIGFGVQFDGWRYATPSEFDQLIINFGYEAIETDCGFGVLHCDTEIEGDSILIETIIKTLGDTEDAFLNSEGAGSVLEISPSGAGYTAGMLGSSIQRQDLLDVAIIGDVEQVWRDTGLEFGDAPDSVITLWESLPAFSKFPNVGSYLVRESPSPVPLPAASWLFLSAFGVLLGLRPSAVSRLQVASQSEVLA